MKITTTSRMNDTVRPYQRCFDTKKCTVIQTNIRSNRDIAYHCMIYINFDNICVTAIGIKTTNQLDAFRDTREKLLIKLLKKI